MKKFNPSTRVSLCGGLIGASIFAMATYAADADKPLQIAQTATQAAGGRGGGGRGGSGGGAPGDHYAPDGGLIIDRGGNVVGGTGNVEPFVEPKAASPEAAKVPRMGRGPDFSGYYAHGLRPWENPVPSDGITPGAYGEPSPVTVLPDESNLRAAERGDYRSPLLRPWTAALIKAQGDINASGLPFQKPSTGLCRPGGVMSNWGRPNTLQIVQTPKEVVLMFKGYAYRTIHLNTGHPANLRPTVNGDSIGHWEGDTLVIDTIGFDGSAALDRFGTPSTEALHMIERIDLRSDNQVLEVHFWVDDPLVFTQPWRSVVTYRRADGMDPETVCQEALMYGHPF